MNDYKKWLIERFRIERQHFDRSGVYAYTQRAMAYLELFRKTDLLKHPEYLQQIGYHTPEANLG